MGLRVKAAIATNVGLKGGLEFPKIVPAADKPTKVPCAKLGGEVSRQTLYEAEVLIEPVESELSAAGFLDMGQRYRCRGPSRYRRHLP